MKTNNISLIQKITWAIILVIIPPFLLFMASYTALYYFTDLLTTMRVALIAFIIGIVIDIIRCKHWLHEIYRFKNWVLISIYVFYSVCIFGFFMGAPIFNLLCGAFAGIYLKEKSINNKIDEIENKKLIQKYSLFTAIVMFLVCLLSGTIAILDPYTPNNLQGMLNLSFEITKPMIWLLVAIGVFTLPVLQYYITKTSAHYKASK